MHFAQHDMTSTLAICFLCHCIFEVCMFGRSFSLSDNWYDLGIDLLAQIMDSANRGFYTPEFGM